ncbi:hypothetical protein V6N12_063033 [Hibiscus sabdariffa]|uniref:Uncharacterized protein n=1 Tax=Hibiscus sabdariffa TaxID=183260 RepID=A0ABR2FAM7_9ROSI
MEVIYHNGGERVSHGWLTTATNRKMVNFPQDTRQSFERFSTTVASKEQRVTGDTKVGVKQQCKLRQGGKADS